MHGSAAVVHDEHRRLYPTACTRNRKNETWREEEKKNEKKKTCFYNTDTRNVRTNICICLRAKQCHNSVQGALTTRLYIGNNIMYNIRGGGGGVRKMVNAGVTFPRALARWPNVVSHGGGCATYHVTLARRTGAPRVIITSRLVH